MKQRKHVKLPMDPALRAQALRVIEVYKTKRVSVGGPLGQMWSEELIPAMMKTISESITAYDNNELSPTLQRKLMRLMKKLVMDYPP